MEISVVIPVYKCNKHLIKLYDRLVMSLENITSDFEIIMVNDASPECDWKIIRNITQKDKRVKGINLSRNFGQHYAITAGLDYVMGNWIIVMDCDLQDQPEEIIKLYQKAQEGYDVVWARRYNRKDSYIKKLRAKVFFSIFDYFAETHTDPYTNTFGIFKKEVIENYTRIREQNRAFTLFVKWLGFNQIAVDVEHSESARGESSYSLKKLLQLSLDYIIIYSNKPLRLSIGLGFFMAFLSFFYAIILVFRRFFYNITVEGWTTIVVSIFFIGGLILFTLGLIGVYIGKIFNETKKRPIYIIKDLEGNFDKKK